MFRTTTLTCVALSLMIIHGHNLSAETPQSSATLLQPFVEKHELAGAVALVANQDGILSVETVGYSNIEANAAMKPDSLFWIASQSKGMTAVAILMLVDEGKNTP